MYNLYMFFLADITLGTSVMLGICTFTFSTLCANSADDKLIIYFLFFPEERFAITCKLARKTLHEVSNSIFWKKK